MGEINQADDMQMQELRSQVFSDPLEHGAKFVGLSQLLGHLEKLNIADPELASGFEIPVTYFIPESRILDPLNYVREYRAAFDALTRSQETPTILWLRSNASHELDGVFTSFPIPYFPAKSEESFSILLNLAAQMASSKKDGYVKNILKKNGLEDKVRMHAMLQKGGSYLPPSDTDLMERDPFLPSILDCIGSADMSFYVYSHSDFNPDLVDIRFAVGLGQGIVGNDSNQTLVNKKRGFMLPLYGNYDLSMSTSIQEFVQEHAVIMDAASGRIGKIKVRETRLAGYLGTRRHFLNWKLEKLADLVKYISQKEGSPVKLEAYCENMLKPGKVLLLQKDLYDLSHSHPEYIHEQRDGYGHRKQGLCLSKMPLSFEGDLVVLTKGFYKFDLSDSMEIRLKVFSERIAELDSILKQPHAISTNEKHSRYQMPVFGSTKVVVNMKCLSHHDHNLFMKMAVSGAISGYFSVHHDNSELSDIKPDITEKFYHVYKHVFIQGDGLKGEMLIR